MGEEGNDKSPTVLHVPLADSPTAEPSFQIVLLSCPAAGELVGSCDGGPAGGELVGSCDGHLLEVSLYRGLDSLLPV